MIVYNYNINKSYVKNSGKPADYLNHHPASLKRVQNKGYSKIPVMTADFRTEFDYTFLIYI